MKLETMTNKMNQIAKTAGKFKPVKKVAIYKVPKMAVSVPKAPKFKKPKY